MIIVDINLLMYATFSRFPEHKAARKWWSNALGGRGSIGIPGVSIFGFVRLSTNRRVLDPPLAVDQALSAVEAWMAADNVSFLQPGPRHLQIAFDLLRAQGAAANLTTDAQLAALAIEYQAELCSNDSDFARFVGLRWTNPLRT